MNNAITMTFPHSLPKNEARSRVEQGMVQVGQQLAQAKLVRFRQEWQGDRLSFSALFLGQQVDGHIDVMDQTVGVEITLPAVLALIANAVRARLRAEAHKRLGKNAGA